MIHTCGHCGATFDVDPSRSKHGRGKHCSKACQYAARKAAPKNHVMSACLGCGKTFGRAPSLMASKKGSGSYCSRPCRDKYRKGPLSPNWRGGCETTYTRGPSWPAARRKALARDNNQCQNCGTGGKLHVHHKIPHRLFPDHEVANDLANLVSLCPKCHRTLEAKLDWATLDGGIIIAYPVTHPLIDRFREITR